MPLNTAPFNSPLFSAALVIAPFTVVKVTSDVALKMFSTSASTLDVLCSALAGEGAGLFVVTKHNGSDKEQNLCTHLCSAGKLKDHGY